jgi:hypothetical protein
MEPLEFGDLPEEAPLVIDSAPIIYVLENHPQLAPRFAPLFAAHAAGRLRFAVTTITVAEGQTLIRYRIRRGTLSTSSRGWRICLISI